MRHLPVDSKIRHVVVLCHPDPDSFNASIADAYCRAAQECGHDTVLRDLYALRFDPVLRRNERPGQRPFLPSPDVEDELNLIESGDVLVLIYPIWFGTAPAMLKGYVDRVLGAGVTARAVRDRAWQNLLTGKYLVSFTASAGSAPWPVETGQAQTLQSLSGEYLARTFGMDQAEHLHFDGIVDGLAPRFIAEHLMMVRDRARRICGDIASAHQDPPHAAAI
jgi:NAD(P)H dehydrogenase (quinone)